MVVTTLSVSIALCVDIKLPVCPVHNFGAPIVERLCPRRGIKMITPQKPPHRFSWNTHSILTSFSIEKLNLKKISRPIIVTGIEELLDRIPAETLATIPELRPNLVRARSIKTEADFLRIARLNPNVSLGHAILKTHNEAQAGWRHSPSRAGPPINSAYLGLREGVVIDSLQALTAYCDEPDWGMDQNLFGIQDYGYGKCPFGMAGGKSSQAAFHMAFLHLNPLVRAGIPGLKRTFLESRVRMCADLSRVAFDYGADYWGFRFMAWHLHYLQDITQPYHSNPFPPPLTPMLVSYIKWPDYGNFLRDNMHYLINRHLMFEAVIHLIVNKIFSENIRHHPFRTYPASAREISSTDVHEALKILSAFSAKNASKIDRLTAEIMAVPDDCELTFGEDFDKVVEATFNQENGKTEAIGAFVELVSQCLAGAGSATKYGLKSAGLI